MAPGANGCVLPMKSKLIRISEVLLSNAMCNMLSVHITEDHLHPKTLQQASVEWEDTNVKCVTYHDFATKAAGGRIDPQQWLYAQYNHSKTKVKDFGSSDEDKLVYTINTWACKSHGTGKKGERCPAKVIV